MKKKLILLLTVVSFLVAFKLINDVLSDVGTTLQEVKQITLEQIAKKNFDLPRYTSRLREKELKIKNARLLFITEHSAVQKTTMQLRNTTNLIWNLYDILNKMKYL